MEKQWSLVDVQRYIDNGIEESQTLEYKAAEALIRKDREKIEITKDVSAMANSAGGIIIYGLKEYDDQDKRHLPEKIDFINRVEYSREWLEQIINTVQPRIKDVVIHPVSAEANSDQVIYVVQIPQSTTAHQARDLKYYRRFNFESVPMNDYEIRDVMNRAILPDVSLEFASRLLHKDEHWHEYVLGVFVKNLGHQVVNNFKVEFTFPIDVSYVRHVILEKKHASITMDGFGDHLISCRSVSVLFPQEEIDIGKDIAWCYRIDPGTYARLEKAKREGLVLVVRWTLYADNMLPKQGEKRFDELHIY